MDDYNIKQITDATKRRKKIYAQFLRSKLSIAEFAKLYHGISRQRMAVIIAKAIQDSVRI